ncbi:MAG: lytic transglycosylase domain-containing protein [Elusimicrobia bacterium]|nr:lytic transglycosylase domain-containing protein [Elusimicrobiota bacterium]
MRPTRTPLAVLVTGSLLLPSALSAQVAGSAVPAARPGASASAFQLPSLDERRHYLADRVDGWHTMIKADSPIAKEFLPEMAAIKKQLLGAKTAADVEQWATVVDAFESRLMDALDPRLPSMAPEERQVVRQSILQEKDALVALNRRSLGADPRTRLQIDALKKQIKSQGFSSPMLGDLFDRAGQLTERGFDPESQPMSAPAAVEVPEVPSAAGASGSPAMTDWTYPRPAVSQRPYGTLEVPDPTWTPGGPMTMDEQKVIAAARRAGLNAGIVDQAYKEAKKQGVDFRMVLAVIKAESSFDPRAHSPTDARGLMQVEPGTGRALGVRNANMLYDVATNIHAGVTYLRGLWDQFVDITWSQLASIDPFTRRDVKSAIAAYNAGPGAVQKYGGVPPYRETRNYVVTVLRNYSQFVRAFSS